MSAMNHETTGRLGPRPAFLWRLLPGLVLGGVLVGMVAASALITQNHGVVSVVAASVLTIPVFGIITLAAARSLAGGRTPFPQAWSGAGSSAPPEPSHIHIPRRSREEEA
jgi:hypothetical protein